MKQDGCLFYLTLCIYSWYWHLDSHKSVVQFKLCGPVTSCLAYSLVDKRKDYRGDRVIVIDRKIDKEMNKWREVILEMLNPLSDILWILRRILLFYLFVESKCLILYLISNLCNRTNQFIYEFGIDLWSSSVIIYFSKSMNCFILIALFISSHLVSSHLILFQLLCLQEAAGDEWMSICPWHRGNKASKVRNCLLTPVLRIQAVCWSSTLSLDEVILFPSDIVQTHTYTRKNAHTHMHTHTHTHKLTHTYTYTYTHTHPHAHTHWNSVTLYIAQSVDTILVINDDLFIQFNIPYNNYFWFYIPSSTYFWFKTYPSFIFY
jgi:hypothetical protein